MIVFLAFCIVNPGRMIEFGLFIAVFFVLWVFPKKGTTIWKHIDQSRVHSHISPTLGLRRSKKALRVPILLTEERRRSL